MLVLAFLSILVVPVGAAQAATPKKAAPKLAIAPTARVGDNISPTITVTFAPPSGTTSAKACAGKVTIKAAIGKKTVTKKGKKKTVVVYSSKSASLKSVGGICTAVGAPKLKATTIGKSVAFTAEFSGNSAIKKFAKTTKLAVTEPAAKITPPAGPTGSAIVLNTGDWSFLSEAGTWFWYAKIEAANTVTKLQRWNNNTISCPGHPSIQIDGAGNATGEEVKWNLFPFSIAQNDFAITAGWGVGVESANLTLTLHIESAERMVGKFRIDGNFSTDGGVYPCTSGDIPITATQGEAG
jgi:hypothetical protein